MRNLGRFIIIFILIGMFLGTAYPASAHPADMFALDQRVRLTRDGMQIEWKIAPGSIHAITVWDQADQNRDQVVSQAEAADWAATAISNWTMTLDGKPVSGLEIRQVTWPDDLAHLQTGEQAILISLSASWPTALKESATVELHDAFQEEISFNYYALNSEEGLSFQAPTQNSGAITFQLYAPGTGQDSTAGANPEALTGWESGRPNLTGLTGALANQAQRLADPTGASNQSSGFLQVADALTGIVRSKNLSAGFLVGAFFLSLALGALHALTPGHGKALVAAYLVGSRGRTVDAVFLGGIVTLTHTGSVMLLGLVSLVASHFILPSLLMPVMEVFSGLLILGLGIQLLFSRQKELRKSLAERKKMLLSQVKVKKKAAPVKGAGNKPAAKGKPAGKAARTQVMDPSHAHVVLQHDHDHDHPHDHDHDQPHEHSHDHEHGHSHLPPGEKVTWKSLLTLGISGGLVPCPDAIAILLVAIAINRIAFGMALIVAFSLGLAGVLIGIGIAMVNGAKVIRKTGLTQAFNVYLPVVSAVVVLVLGIALTATSVKSVLAASQQSSPAREMAAKASSTGSESAAAVSTAAFDLSRASIVYLAQDANRHNQLFRQPAAGGEAVQLTQASEGVAEFTISPDNRTILYSLFKADGSSAFYALPAGGTQASLVLDCPQSVCKNPVYAPDMKKILYDRLDHPINTAVVTFSIWQLDPQSGETQAVFQDQKFPANAPGFSYDGAWMSYFAPSPANQIQGYHLADGRSFSFNYSIGTPVIWSPVADTILYWDLQVQNDQTLLRLKLYDVNTNQSADLNPVAGESDYTAAWSPDGQWIAISRGGTYKLDPAYKQEIWLVKADGSESRVLIDRPGTTYSNLSWSPDGRYLMFASLSNQAKPEDGELWVKDLNTGEEVNLMRGGNYQRLLP